MNRILVFTDGAAKGNPGPGGYGAVVLSGERVYEIGAGRKNTTNNEMELQAVVEALETLKGTQEHIDIYSDSKYVVQGATGWVFGWVKNGWKTQAKQDVLHKKLWSRLIDLMKGKNIEWHKIPGHVDLIGNECADRIASNFAQGKKVALYDGQLKNYEHDLTNISYDEQKAEERSNARKRQNQKAHSYISMVDDVVEIHATWAECEKRVKGKKARFKKALSANEQTLIIKQFKEA